MLYNGKRIAVAVDDDGIARMVFDAQGESVNKFDAATNLEFAQAVEALEKASHVKGLIVQSGKKVFIAGADITEFVGYFQKDESQIEDWLLQINAVFNRFEDLPFPKVAAINGAALGGGCEMALVCEYRVMAKSAQIGLPETSLGIFPGFGGSVRAPRLVGIDNALELIATAKPQKPLQALAIGLVDAVVDDDRLSDAAADLLKQCIDGKQDWQARRREKCVPVLLDAIERAMAFESAKGVIFAKANPKQYPAIALAIDAIQNHVHLPRNEALLVEAKNFAKAAKTPQAQALVGLFLNDQKIKKIAKSHAKDAKDVQNAAVLGAGIMGGGIAYQSASKGVPIAMKDIAQSALDLGLQEASALLAKQVERKKITLAQMGETLARIRPSLSYEGFDKVDIVVEAVTENAAIKKSVLTEAEAAARDDAVIASNTSTISITELAKALRRPENFVGMHFFNPVHRMPLVEVICGEQSSPQAVATAVALAQKMGKTPIVVNDCPGFLVNRVLFPYFGAFDLLLKDGADFVQIDKTMEKFGWPMGPAYLIDVVGIDTGVHGAKVMAEGYPDRMRPDFVGAVETMYQNGRLGQKNGAGFYKYETDKKGKKVKRIDDAAYAIVAQSAAAPVRAFDEQEIVDRMMLALCNETVRALEDRIVGSAAEADMAMILGIGFAPFRGGPCRYIDQMGVSSYVALCEKYAHLGKAYQAPPLLLDMAKNSQTFYAQV